MRIEDLTEKILELIGGKTNVCDVQNCMTRLRVTVADMEKVDVPNLMALEDVLGVVKENPIQIILGPGKVQKAAAEFKSSLKDGYVKPVPLSLDKSWEDNKAAHATHHRMNPLRDILAKVSGIFTPMIPAVIAAGLCSGIGGLLQQWAPQNLGALLYLSQFLQFIGNTFFYGFTVFTGIYAAKAFGASPALGGLLGAMTLTPASCALPGMGGGILGVILGAWVLSVIEKWLRNRVPDRITLLVTPFVSLLLSSVIFIYLIMPSAGWAAQGIVKGIRFLTDSPYLAVRLVTGFILSACFLPLVMGGHHHIFVVLYALELQLLGDISLLPCLIMAGAGQVGASLAIGLKAGKRGNTRMEKLIEKAIPGAVLGVGEPLIYGVTLPMKKPFLTAGLGAGFGGALCLAMKVRMCAWGISGIAAIPLMLDGAMMLYFLGALLLSYIMGFVITMVMVPGEGIQNG